MRYRSSDRCVLFGVAKSPERNTPEWSNFLTVVETKKERTVAQQPLPWQKSLVKLTPGRGAAINETVEEL